VVFFTDRAPSLIGVFVGGSFFPGLAFLFLDEPVFPPDRRQMDGAIGVSLPASASRSTFLWLGCFFTEKRSLFFFLFLQSARLSPAVPPRTASFSLTFFWPTHLLPEGQELTFSRLSSAPASVARVLRAFCGRSRAWGPVTHFWKGGHLPPPPTSSFRHPLSK